jgi:hypothetical protein
MKPVALLLAAALATGCTMSQGRIDDVFSSLPYDEMPCAQLIERRDEIARQHAIPRDYRRGPDDPTPSRIATETGWLIPDLRGQQRRDRDRALGLVSAMNGSIQRRRCEG